MKQHFIPKVYLKQFENIQKHLYALNNHPHKQSPKIREVSRTQIGYHHDFYTIKNQNSLQRLGLTDTDQEVIENKYNAKNENRYSKLLQKLLSGSAEISQTEAKEFLLILLSFKQRNPVFRKTFQNPQVLLDSFERHLQKSILPLKATLDIILEREGRMNFEEFVDYGRDYMHRVAHDPNTPQDIHTEGIVRMHQNKETAIKEIAENLMDYKWFVFKTTVRYPFITSDNPGFCFDDDEQIHNLNFGNSSGFFFPLTPWDFLIISAHFHEEVTKAKTINQRIAKPELVQLLNRGTFQVSYKKVFCNDANTLKNVWQDMCRFFPDLNADSNENRLKNN
jgi:hypothetical protein